VKLARGCTGSRSAGWKSAARAQLGLFEEERPVPRIGQDALGGHVVDGRRVLGGEVPQLGGRRDDRHADAVRCVTCHAILLEPVDTTDLASVLETLGAEGGATEPTADGATSAGDPLAVLHSTGYRAEEVSEACLRMAAAVEWGTAALAPDWNPASTPVRSWSRRQVAQMVLYTAWFDVLAQGLAETDGVATDDPRVGAENAILHFVLPNLEDA
jgi:hypothetical protein